MQLQAQMFSNTISLQLLTEPSLILHFHRNNFLIIVKIELTSTFLYIKPTDKTEIENVISSLDSNKSIGPNGIPNKIEKNLKITVPVNCLKY